ncbi:hypothetical protein [Pseudomonas sp. B329]|uniref:hypothetical protein n=1 Tax=Pseudomonas sp. B329 TaxID=1553459 RepID=UPI0020048231|nr:hypothetical protein [Pseudomonas sp. B329]MCK3866142.1 hypothetical protein [Pseudomonas sp. B329]
MAPLRAHLRQNCFGNSNPAIEEASDEDGFSMSLGDLVKFPTVEWALSYLLSEGNAGAWRSLRQHEFDLREGDV